MKDKTAGSTYAIFERLQWLIESTSFRAADYMKRFEISRSAFFRDISFINTYKDYSVTYNPANKMYEVKRDGTYRDYHY